MIPRNRGAGRVHVNWVRGAGWQPARRLATAAVPCQRGVPSGSGRLTIGRSCQAAPNCGKPQTVQSILRASQPWFQSRRINNPPQVNNLPHTNRRGARRNAWIAGQASLVRFISPKPTLRPDSACRAARREPCRRGQSGRPCVSRTDRWHGRPPPPLAPCPPAAGTET